MKKLTLLFVAASLLAGTAFAQEKSCHKDCSKDKEATTVKK